MHVYVPECVSVQDAGLAIECGYTVAGKEWGRDASQPIVAAFIGSIVYTPS